MKLIKKPWGLEEVIEINDKCMRPEKLTMKSGRRCSLQYHEFKRNHISNFGQFKRFLLETKKIFLKSKFYRFWRLYNY